MTFAPAWWHARYGLSFSEPAWRDPVARTELDREMRRLTFERFGDVGLGERDPQPLPNVEAYGHRFMAAFWGCEIRYTADQPPAAVPLPDAAERLATCRAPDPAASPVIRRALEEARLLQARYGTCSGDINWGGPLNNAVSVFGQEILAALLAEPDTARWALMEMARALLVVYEHVTCPIRRLDPHARRASGGVGNCPVCMISPDAYRDVVLPADRWYREHFVDFGIHHCGAAHPYAELYRTLGVCELQLGWLSDRAAVRRVFPDLRLKLMLEASVLAGKSRAEIDALVAAMLREAGPPRLIPEIAVADVGLEVSDQTVRDFMTALERIALPV